MSCGSAGHPDPHASLRVKMNCRHPKNFHPHAPARKNFDPPACNRKRVTCTPAPACGWPADPHPQTRSRMWIPLIHLSVFLCLGGAPQWPFQITFGQILQRVYFAHLNRPFNNDTVFAQILVLILWPGDPHIRFSRHMQEIHLWLWYIYHLFFLCDPINIKGSLLRSKWNSQ